MSAPTHFRDRADMLMSAQKHLPVGAFPSWEQGPYTGCKRWLSPLAIDGQVIDMKLCVDYYPTHSYIDFHINLIYEVTIERLDFSCVEKHRNHTVEKVAMPPSVRRGWISGPHHHRWCDNRMLAGYRSPPKELQFAVEVSESLSFDSAFRLFCGSCNVTIGANQTPNPPSRDTII